MIIKEKKITILILSFLIVLTSIWLIPKGLPYSHDVAYHYTRLVGLTNTIKNGDFIALIHDMLNGYGYENGLFYSNFFFYIPAFLSCIGLSYIASYKIFYFLINLATVLVSYKCFKSILKDNRYALLTTTLYTLATYRIMDLIVRGATGENLAFIFIPLIILGLYEIIYRDYKKWYLFTIGFVFLLLSHLITTILMGIICLIIILINIKKFISEKDRIKYLLLSGFIGILLGAFFLFPIIEAYLAKNIKIFVYGSPEALPSKFSTKILELFIPLELLIKNVGYGIYILLAIIYFYKKENKKENNFANILVITGLVLIIFTTNIFPWKLIDKYVTFIQFPWRLLAIITPFIILGTSIYSQNITNKKALTKIYKYSVIITFLMASAYIGLYTIIMPRYHKFPEEIGNQEYTIKDTVINKKSDNSNELDLSNLSKDRYITNNEDLLFTYEKHGKNIHIKYQNNNTNNTYIEVPLFNYTGYKASGAKIKNGDNNVIRLILDNKTEGEIKLHYEMTSLEKISYIISGISWLVFIAYLITKNKKSL